MADDAWYTERGFLVAAVVVAVLVVVGGAVALTGGSEPAKTLPARVQGKPVATGGSVCGLPIGNPDPVVGPPEAEWALVGSIAAPAAKGIGPGVVAGHDRRCYAHSALGATFAAANLLALSSLPDGRLAEDAALAHFVPSRVVDVYAKQPARPLDPSSRFQLAGVRVAVVDRDNVLVTLAVRSNINGGAMGSWSMPMRWFDGDWRLRLISIQAPFQAEPIASLSGFIPWSGA